MQPSWEIIHLHGTDGLFKVIISWFTTEKKYREAHFSSGHNICTKLQKHNYRNWQNPEPGLVGPHQSTSWTSSFIFGSIWSYPWTKWSCLVPHCCLIVHHGMVNSAAPMVKIDLVTFQLIAISLSLSLSLSWRAYDKFFWHEYIFPISSYKELLGLVWNHVKTTWKKKKSFPAVGVSMSIISAPVEGTFIMAGLKL